MLEKCHCRPARGRREIVEYLTDNQEREDKNEVEQLKQNESETKGRSERRRKARKKKLP